jgi:hypothetical protein
MIARIWHGTVPVSKTDEYLDLMRRIALPEYLATRGNRGAWCLHRTDADVTHFEMLTFWDDIDAIKRFAGENFNFSQVLRLRLRLPDRKGGWRSPLRSIVGGFPHSMMARL